jgi:L-iditol 2-dehydrogenase
MLPETARASVLDKINGSFVVKSYPIPDPAPKTMVLKVELSGICGTDIHIYNGKMPGVPYPLILGHEVVGTIVALGKGITKDLLGNPVKIGDRVCPIGAMGCNECYVCTVLHTPNRCPNEETFGFYPDPDKEPYLSGGFAEYLYIHRPNPPFIKTDIAPESAVLLDTLATGVHAVQRARMQNGDTVVVQGTGIIGIVTIVAAKLAGATKVIAIGSPKERMDYAKLFGADIIIDKNEIKDVKERINIVKENTAGKYGADIVFGCTSTVTSINEGFACLRNSGTYCELGNFCDTGTFEANMGLEIVQRNLNVIGVFAQTIEHFYRGLMILEKKGFPYEKLVTHKVPLDRIKEIIDNKSRYLDGKMALKVVVDPWIKK